MNPFLISTQQIGPLKLRPWTLTTQLAIAELGLDSLPEVKQMAAMGWLQSQDEGDVIAELNAGTARQSIQEFTQRFPLTLLQPLAAWCAEQSRMIEDARVDVVPKKGAFASTEGAPGNS
jgi:hypothetical protein